MWECKPHTQTVGSVCQHTPELVVAELPSAPASASGLGTTGETMPRATTSALQTPLTCRHAGKHKAAQQPGARCATCAVRGTLDGATYKALCLPGMQYRAFIAASCLPTCVKPAEHSWHVVPVYPAKHRQVPLAGMHTPEPQVSGQACTGKGQGMGRVQPLSATAFQLQLNAAAYKQCRSMHDKPDSIACWQLRCPPAIPPSACSGLPWFQRRSPEGSCPPAGPRWCAQQSRRCHCHTHQPCKQRKVDRRDERVS